MPKSPLQELISAAAIQQRVAQLGATLTAHYQTSEALLLVGLLRGSFIFMADLCRHIALPHEIDFMIAASYGDDSQSRGSVTVLKDLETEVAGKDLLIVEDIVDSGHTLSQIQALLQKRSPKSLAICTLLDKPSRREMAVDVQWCGFTIPDQFIVGYGMDYAQQYRHIDFIGTLIQKSEIRLRRKPLSVTGLLVVRGDSFMGIISGDYLSDPDARKPGFYLTSDFWSLVSGF